VNYNTSKLLYECISSIIDKTKIINYEIIIVDNASSDDSVKLVKHFFPLVKIIASKENLGFGKGNNLGAEFANGKYLFLLNTDTLLINNAIKVLFDFMEEESSQNIAACGGNLFRKDLSPNYSYSLNFPSLYSIFIYRMHISFLSNKEYFNKSDITKEVAFIIGADLFIRKRIFVEINGFDPLFFMYVEDTELLYRIHKMKYKIVSNPNAKIIHLQGASSTTFFKLKNEIDSYFIYFSKHFNLYTVKVYKLIEILSSLVKLTIALLTFKLSKFSDHHKIIKYILSIDSKQYIKR
jgi:GT2 family glycosyltransferase